MQTIAHPIPATSLTRSSIPAATALVASPLAGTNASARLVYPTIALACVLATASFRTLRISRAHTQAHTRPRRPRTAIQAQCIRIESVRRILSTEMRAPR
eukprot:6183957-Pleurochrysis_carterae.AAC.6